MEPGLITANLLGDVEEPAVLVLHSAWSEDSALEAHVRSDAFGAVLGALELLTLDAELTLLRKDGGHPEGVLEWIRRLRQTGRSVHA